MQLVETIIRDSDPLSRLVDNEIVKGDLELSRTVLDYNDANSSVDITIDGEPFYVSVFEAWEIALNINKGKHILELVCSKRCGYSGKINLKLTRKCQNLNVHARLALKKKLNNFRHPPSQYFPIFAPRYIPPNLEHFDFVDDVPDDEECEECEHCRHILICAECEDESIVECVICFDKVVGFGLCGWCARDKCKEIENRTCRDCGVSPVCHTCAKEGIDSCNCWLSPTRKLW